MPDPLLTVEALTYTYPDGTPALHGVDMSMSPGEKVGLVGPNGSGKSTLLLCVSGLFNGGGAVTIDGISPGRGADRSNRNDTIRDKVGLVFQSPDDQLFMPTLADDLAFGPINLGLSEADVRARVDEAAAALDLTHMLERPPHHLSMGQKRNAAIATVLAMRPPLLLMDEPTSNLDPRSRRRLIETLTGLEAAILIASHDLDLVGRVCPRILVIDEGTIQAAGATPQVLGNADLMHAHGLEPWPNNDAIS